MFLLQKIQPHISISYHHDWAQTDYNEQFRTRLSHRRPRGGPTPAWVTCESDVNNAIDENIIHDQGYVEALLNRGAKIPFRTIGLLFIFEFRILWWPLSERFRGRRSLKHEKSRDLCVVMRWIGSNGLRNRWPISEENQATWLISLCNYTGVLPC